MRKLLTILVLIVAVAIVLTGCASTGKHVKEIVDNVHYYLLFGDEYTYW